MIQMFRPFLIIILLLFFVGNFLQFLVEGMDPPHRAVVVEPPTQEISLTELSFLLRIINVINLDDIDDGKIIGVIELKGTNELVVAEFDHEEDEQFIENILQLYPKIGILCNYYEQIIEASVAEFNQWDEDRKILFIHERIDVINKFDPDRANKIISNYNIQLNGQFLEIDPRFLNEIFEISQMEKNYFVYYNLIMITLNLYANLENKQLNFYNRLLENNQTPIKCLTIGVFSRKIIELYESLSKKVFSILEYTEGGEVKDILINPDDKFKISFKNLIYLKQNKTYEKKKYFKNYARILLSCHDKGYLCGINHYNIVGLNTSSNERGVGPSYSVGGSTSTRNWRGRN
ncbi:hypothetical protein ACQ4LE_001882 [Meloidogyne hapla]